MITLQDIVTEDIEMEISNSQIPLVKEIIEGLIQNKKYVHYLQIPDRVSAFLDYFEIQYDDYNVQISLSTYFLWLKVADNEIDENSQTIGDRIKDRLVDPEIKINKETNSEPVLLLTEILKNQVNKSVYDSFVGGLNELYDAVLQERYSSTMTQYIINRKNVGRLTAYCAFEIMKPYLDNRQEIFLEFFQRLGSLGCLVDSVVDIKRDAEDGMLRFKPSINDRIKLYLNTIKEGTELLFKYPGLYRCFLNSTANVIREKYL